LRYNMDQEQGTITITDEHTGQTETARLSELVELLFWLRSRESDLRGMVYKAAPITIRQAMRPVGGYYVGVVEQQGRGRPVKVKAERWQTVMQEQERIVRENWAFTVNDERKLKRGPIHLEQFDRQGNKIPYMAEEAVTAADAPLFLVQERLYTVSQPNWWVDREDNLQLGQWAKLP
jgi:hypothetical protein